MSDMGWLIVGLAVLAVTVVALVALRRTKLAVRLINAVRSNRLLMNIMERLSLSLLSVQIALALVMVIAQAAARGLRGDPQHRTRADRQLRVDPVGD